MKAITRLALVFISLAIFWHMMGCGGGTASPLDTDHDGIADIDDTDDDGDGIFDVSDSFPLDASESADLDGDGIGDNADDDADGDAVLSDNDCDDLDASVYPDATDLPDDELTDSNCDGIDGELHAIWVSATEGNDANTGTIDSPVATITHGVALASTLTDGQRYVNVATGTYAEDVHLTSNVSLFGGYGLLADGTRIRNLALYRPVISGAASSLNTTLTFHNGPFTIDYTLFVDSTQSYVMGFTIEGDPVGLCVMTKNAHTQISDNIISDNVPTVERTMSLTIANFIDNTTTEAHSVFITHNQILMQGNAGYSSGSDSYTNVGVLTYPTVDADGSLTVQVQENTFNSYGTTGELIAVLAADDDDDPSDASAGDGHADIGLIVDGNEMNLQSSFAVGLGIVGGYNYFGSFQGPDLDTLFYLDGLTITDNVMRFDVDDPEGLLAVTAGFVRRHSVVANNLISVVGSPGGLYAFANAGSDVDYVYNTLAVNSQGGHVIGFYSLATEDQPGLEHYNTNRLGRVTDNIFSLELTTTSPSCAVAAMIESADALSDSFVTAASPEEMRNNDIYVSTNCAKVYYYVDQTDVSTTTPIASFSDLGSDAIFRPDDPTVFSGNISADPLFTDDVAGDYTLQSTSPCVDTGLEFETGWTDIAGTARPQGDGVDMGAWERGN